MNSLPFSIDRVSSSDHVSSRDWGDRLIAASIRLFVRRLAVVFACVVTLAPGSGCVADEIGDSGGRAARSADWARWETRLAADMGYLASDELRGRDIGSEGLEMAAQYIADSFATSGLVTDSFSGEPFQTFSIPTGVTLGDAERNRLTIRGDESAAEPLSAALGEAFRPLAIGGSRSAEGRLVFVGYGITAEDKGYDDYADVDVEGAVVMMIRKEPQGPAADAVFDGEKNTRHAYFETKIRTAAERGAIGVMLVNDPDSIAAEIASIDGRIAAEKRQIKVIDSRLETLPEAAENIRKAQSQRREAIESMIVDLRQKREAAAEGLLEVNAAGTRPFVDELPVVSIGWSLASQLLQATTGKSLADIKAQIDEAVEPRSARLKVEVELETALSPAEAPSSNVIGVLPGRGALAEQTVVVGAHYDHVGMGGPGSLAPGTVAIHNGADDNASGTCVLLASVDQIKAALAEQTDHRRVVFIAFTGEERGLLGSEYYVRNPLFPLESTVAMINLDMVGRLQNDDLTVYGTGTAEEFDALVDRANRDTELELFKVPGGYGPSDHQSFYMREIPVLFFFTGLHSDYHRPSDKIDKINFNGMARITDITSVVVSELATSVRPPRYAETDRDVNIRQQPRAYLGVSLRDAPGRDADGANGDKADRDGPIGVIVTSVAEGSPAEKCGIRSGDRLVRLDGRAITEITDVIEYVGSRSAGDELKIGLRREGRELTLSAKLSRRPGE